MLKNCTICKKDFEASRDTARFCSGACVKKNQRLGGQKEPLSGQEDVQLETINVQLEGHNSLEGHVSEENLRGDELAKFYRNLKPCPNTNTDGDFCLSCQEPVSKQICICLKCVGNKVTHHKLGFKHI